MKKKSLLLIFLLFSLTVFASNTKMTFEMYQKINNNNKSYFKNCDSFLNNEKNIKIFLKSFDDKNIYNKKIYKLVNKDLKKENKYLNKNDILKLNVNMLNEENRYSKIKNTISYEQCLYLKIFTSLSFYKTFVVIK